MKITVDEHFNIKDIMECGQAFRYEVLGVGHYDLFAFGKRLRVAQKNNEVTFECQQHEYDTLWYPYFDMATDYGDLKSKLIHIDGRMASYIKKKPGIRILRQEPFEMLMTFILSQNKSMPQIKQLVARLSEHYGLKSVDAFGPFSAFPSPEALAKVSEEEFRDLKVGFRAPYLVDAINKVMSKEVDLNSIEEMSTDEARALLLKIKGVGRKVADCVLLFGYHRMDVFPVDVWMRRVVSQLYFENEKVTDSQMLLFAQEKFGQLSGIGQQYLFYGTVDSKKGLKQKDVRVIKKL